METMRQKKIAKLIQTDLADVLLKELKANGVTDMIVTVSKVWVSTDLSVSKVYVSVFPENRASDFVNEINKTKACYKNKLAIRTKNQLRRVPELSFYVDDTLSYIEGIENSLKGNSNPLEL